MKKKYKCECPEVGSVSFLLENLYSDEERPGMNHEPNKCEGTYLLRRYRRNGKELILCSCCFLDTDELIGELE